MKSMNYLLNDKDNKINLNFSFFRKPDFMK